VERANLARFGDAYLASEAYHRSHSTRLKRGLVASLLSPYGVEQRTMNAPRLDSLARTLATTPRRPVLKAAAASVAAALLGRVRPSAAATPGRCNGQKCTGHEKCCDIFDCSGAVCVATPGCVDVRSDPFHCGSCEQVCDDACCKGECCFRSGGQVCLPQGCGCADRRLSSCGAGCVDLQTDPFNCGACSTFCSEGMACEEGQCQA
jgi:hypothetical protein